MQPELPVPGYRCRSSMLRTGCRLSSIGRPRRPVDALAVRRDAVRLGAAAVLDPADVCEDGAAETRRRAGRVVGRHGVLSDGVAGRLRLRSFVEPRAAASPGRDVPSVADRGHSDDAADRHRARMGSSAIGWDGALAVRIVCGFHRASILCAVGQCALAAKLVCRERAQAGGQPLRALRRIQSRLVCRAVRLSGRHRAVPDAEDADRGLVLRICAARRASLCRRPVRCTRGTGRRAGRAADEVRRARPNECAGLRLPRFRPASSSRSRRT